VNAAALNSRPGKAAAVAGVCGLIVLVSLFGSWAQIVCVLEPCPYPSGWEVLEVLDVPIALLGLAAAALAVLVIVRATPGLALALSLVGAVTLVLVLLAPLVEDRGVRPVDFGGSWFLGLLATLGVVAGGLLAFFLLRPTKEDRDEQEDEEG
jgi:hypothetical protein